VVDNASLVEYTLDMKKSIISEMYYGRRRGDEMGRSEQYEILYNNQQICEEALLKNFLPEQITQYEKCQEAAVLLLAEECRAHYVEGFRLGVLVGIECAEQ
jgi:hypothetical protein